MLRSGFISERAPGNDRMRLLMAFIGAWIIVAATTLFAFRLPEENAGAQRLDHIAGYLVGYAVCSGGTLLLVKRIMRPLWSLRTGYLLCGFAALAGLGIGLNLSGYCSFPGSWIDPLPGKWTDAARDWNYTTEYMATGYLSPHVPAGYIVFSGTLMQIFGYNIAVPLLVNLMFSMGTVAATGYLCSVFFPKRGKEAAFWGGLAMALIGNLVWHATLFQKDAGVTFAFTLCSISVAKLLKEKFDTSLVICGMAGGLLLMLLKGPMGWFLIAGVCAACSRYCRKRPERYRRLYSFGIYMLLIGSAIVAGGQHWRRIDSIENVAGGNNVEFQRGMANCTAERYNELIPGYFMSGPIERLEKLPLTATAQYFPPFPWNYTRDSNLGKFVWAAHFPWMWYLLGGAALGYVLFCAFRRRKDGDMGRWAVWFAICYLGSAYYSGGTVARYYLPFIPMVVPMAMQFAGCVRKRLVSRKKALIYSITYCAALAGGLLSAYIYLKG